MMDEKHYKLTYQDCVKELSDSELVYMLSSGTTKSDNRKLSEYHYCEKEI